MKRQIQGQNKYSLFTRLPGPGGCFQSARSSTSELAAVQNLLQFQHVQGWDFGDFKEDPAKGRGVCSV